MKLSHDIGPKTWITPLVGEDGGEPNTERWWESERLLLVTSVRGGDMIHMLLYDRDDDEDMEPWGHELGLGPDDLPMGTKARIYHADRVWTLDKLIGLPTDRVPGITNALANAYGWIAGDGGDVQQED